MPSKSNQYLHYTKDTSDLANDFNAFFTTVGQRAATASIKPIKEVSEVLELSGLRPMHSKGLLSLQDKGFHSLSYPRGVGCTKTILFLWH